MPAPINVTVSWDAVNNRPAVSINPISVAKANGATVITWSGDSTVSNFTISGLDSTQFTLPPGNPNPYTVTDQNTVVNNYTYTVSATHAASGRKGSHDPAIDNMS